MTALLTIPAPAQSAAKSAAALAWRFWPAMAGAAALAALAAAHLSERVGFEPCYLCYVQRWAMWAVLALSAATAWIWWRRPESLAARGADALLAVAFLAGAGVALYHAGVEWGWWLGPNICTSSPVSVGDGPILLDEPIAVVSCEMAPFRVAGLSMAGWNIVFCLILAGTSAASAARGVFNIRAETLTHKASGEETP